MWPPSLWGVLRWCVAPLLVGRAALGCGVLCCLVLCCVRWCVSSRMVGRAAFVLGLPLGGVCCGGVWPPPWWGVLCRCVWVSVAGVLAASLLGLFCWFVVVPATLRPALWGVGCPLCLPGRDGRAGVPGACGAPPVCPGQDGRAGLPSACGAPPRVFVLRLSLPCRSCSPARPPLSCVCAAPCPALLCGAACCCALPPTPSHPSACCLLPPLYLLVSLRLQAAVAPSPPSPGFSFAGHWHFGPRFPLSSLSSLCLVVALRRLAVCWRLLLGPPSPGFVFCGCRRPATCLPLFSFCLLVRRWAVCPPPPRVLCFWVLLLLPCAGWCWRAVLACSVLCGPVLLLAVLCCSGCGAPCRVVPCLVVLRGWCGAALRFLVWLHPAACSAMLGGTVLCCRALRRSLGCCVLVLCAVLSRCVLLWCVLCRPVSVGVVLLAVCCWLCAVQCCAVLCCAVVCCCVLSCAVGRGVWLRCAVPSSLWLAVSSWSRCCVLCCAPWCCAGPCCVVLCCVVLCCCALCCGGGAALRCLAVCGAASCRDVPSGALRCLGCCVLCCVLCRAVLCRCVLCCALECGVLVRCDVLFVLCLAVSSVSAFLCVVLCLSVLCCAALRRVVSCGAVPLRTVLLVWCCACFSRALWCCCVLCPVLGCCAVLWGAVPFGVALCCAALCCVRCAVCVWPLCCGVCCFLLLSVALLAPCGVALCARLPPCLFKNRKTVSCLHVLCPVVSCCVLPPLPACNITTN